MNYDCVAELYDSFVKTRKDIPFWVNEARQVKGAVLELMCGTGRVSIPLLKAKVRLTSVDASAKMLWILRQKLLSKNLFAQIFQMDITELCLLNRFDLVLFPFNSFSEILGKKDRLEVLQRIYDHLIPGGMFICTLHNPRLQRIWANGKLKRVGNIPMAHSGGSLRVLVQHSLMPSGDAVTGVEVFEVFDASEQLIQKKTIPLQFALIEKAEMEEMASKVGFRKVALFGDYDKSKYDPLTSPSMIWKWKKPRSPKVQGFRENMGIFTFP